MLKVRKIRKAKGMSIPELSRISSVPIRTIEDIEKREDCKVSTLKKLAASLNVKIDDLV